MSSFQPVRFGKYLLLEKFAVGGMAQLYRAKITGVQGFEKLIAIKQILPHLAGEKELVSAFIDEAKLAALLNHQNIVQIYDFGEMEGSYFISMEYLFGKDLRIIANKSREKNLPLGFAYALYIASRICSGLDYAHKLKDFQGKPLNFIHRDISPQNILITYEGDVKIVDFGIAKAASQSTITQVGMIKGKVAYMSPEQAAGKTIDRHSDIFSAGILLYEMVTGTRMFKGDTLQILSKVREGEFEPPEKVTSGLPPKLYEILHLALAKNPGQRYQSCAEMLADLEECMYGLSQRPTTRGLAQYMKKLFEEEIAAEEKIMREAAQITIPGELEVEKDVPLAKKNEEEKAGLIGEQATPRKQKKTRLLYGALAAVLAGMVLIFVFWPKEKPPLAPDRGMPAAPRQTSVPGPPERTVPGNVLPSTPAKAPEKVPDPQARARALQNQALKLMEKQPREAKSLLLQAIQLNPKSVQGHFQLGLVYAQLKNYPKAIERYHKVAQLNPQFPDAFFNLGYVYAKTKDYAKAEEMYSRVVKLAPSYLDEALFNLAMVQKKQGKTKESMKNLEQALMVNPNNKLAKEFIRKLKIHSGKNR
jgi:tetratricopeptide (TPR) repeat protein